MDYTKEIILLPTIAFWAFFQSYSWAEELVALWPTLNIESAAEGRCSRRQQVKDCRGLRIEGDKERNVNLRVDGVCDIVARPTMYTVCLNTYPITTQTRTMEATK